MSRMLLFALPTTTTAPVSTSESDDSPILANRILPVVMVALLVGIS
jgi:hypothetical protein